MTPPGVIGGLAVENFGDDMTLAVQGSKLSGNTVSLNNNSGANAFGGLAVANFANDMTLAVQGSTLSGNTVSADNSTLLTADGGLAAVNFSSSTLNIDVDHSVLTFNTNGIAVHGATDVEVKRSIIAWNANYGLSAPAVPIAVTNPIYFNDKVNLDSGGAITFPGLTPSTDQHVICLPFGNCFVVTPD